MRDARGQFYSREKKERFARAGPRAENRNRTPTPPGLTTSSPSPPPRPCPLSSTVLCKVMHACSVHTRVCRATACCTERSRPALGLQLSMQSINQPVCYARCNPSPSEPSINRLASHVFKDSRDSIDASKSSPPWSNGVQCSTLPHSKSDLPGFGPIMLSLPPNRHAASV